MKICMTDTLLYYDGPRLVLAADADGAAYVADLVSEDHEDEQFQAVQVGPESLVRFVGGQMDLRELFLREGVRGWFVSDPIASRGDEIVLVQQQIPICDSDTLPSSGVKLRCSEGFVAEIGRRAEAL